jgi:hypothetical protein
VTGCNHNAKWEVDNLLIAEQYWKELSIWVVAMHRKVGGTLVDFTNDEMGVLDGSSRVKLPLLSEARR